MDCAQIINEGADYDPDAFTGALRNMINASDSKTFGLWYDRLSRMNEDELTRYLVLHINDIKPEFLRYIVENFW